MILWGKERRYTIASHLVAFGLLVTLPIVLLAAALLALSLHAARTQAETRLVQLASDLAGDIDRDVERHVLVLNTLSVLPSFHASDWESFHHQASQALQGDGYIVVIDREFLQLANTYVLYGRQPPRTGDIATAQRVLTSRNTEVSDVFQSLVTNGPVINVDVPVLRGGEVANILIYARPVEHIARIVAGQSTGQTWSGAVYDRAGVPIARSNFGGGPAPTARTGVSQWRGADGAMLRATHVSATSGWTIVVDVPLSAATSAINRSFLLWLLLAGFALLLTIGLGLIFGRFMTGQLQRAVDYAASLDGDQAQPAPPATTLREVEAMTQTLATKSADINRRRRVQELLSGELNHRVKNILSVVQAVVKRTFASPRPPEQSLAIAMQRLQALARSQDLLTQSGWSAQPLRQIVELELSHFSDRIVCEGPDVSLRPEAVQKFAMVLHELLTNAIKHGALRGEAGEISVRWSVEVDGPQRRLMFCWKERCQSAPAEPGKKGFGAGLIAGAFANSSVEIEPDGLIYRFRVDADSILAGASSEASDWASANKAPA